MKHLVVFFFVLVLFGSLGQFVGSLVFMQLRHIPLTPSLLVLFDALTYYRADLMSEHVQQQFYIASGVSLAITVLPPLIFLLALIIKKKPSLHGDARFANDMEMRPYLYKGSYQ
ncbi:hypothetical protein QB953_004452 [Salmonella enterica]|nr:hypothetical protein [Salmonella enterica]